MNPFETLVIEERQPRNENKLEAGVYHCTISNVVYTDDQSLLNGEPLNNVERKRDWVDKNPVVYFYLTCPEGVHHVRFYFYGYKKWTEILGDKNYAKDIMKYRPPMASDCRQYAIIRETNERIKDQVKSDNCMRLIYEFGTAAGCKGMLPKDMVGAQLYIKLTDQFRDGRKYMKMAVNDKPMEMPIAGPTAGIPQAIRVTQADMDKVWDVQA